VDDRAANNDPRPPCGYGATTSDGEDGGDHNLDVYGDSSTRTGPGLVRPCMNERTREGEAGLDGVGGDATRCSGDTLARATISSPLGVTREWLSGVKAICTPKRCRRLPRAIRRMTIDLHIGHIRCSTLRRIIGLVPLHPMSILVIAIPSPKERLKPGIRGKTHRLSAIP
jgi:hypothetical protein